jgi:exodeoxyribonuclease V alpha subunit
MRDIQVISPLREKSPLACKPINEILQKRLNPVPLPEKEKFKVGDKVIQTKNDYGLGIVNGDIGYIKEIDKKDEKKIVVDFENPARQVNVDLYVNKLELAYSLTCHKMQGSEAPIIVIPIHECLGARIPDRPWVYTAISRASKVCVLVGQKKELQAIIARNYNYKRFTGLNGKIVECDKEFEVKKNERLESQSENHQKCNERCEGECIDDINGICPNYMPDYMDAS